MRADWFAPRYLFGDDLRRDILALPLKRQNGFADLILHLSDEVIAGVRVSGELVPNLSVSKKALSIELPQSFIKSSVACFAAIKESRSSLLVGSFFSNHRSVEIPSESHSISEISHAGGGAPASRRATFSQRDFRVAVFFITASIVEKHVDGKFALYYCIFGRATFS
jgi:hypothetical protein